MKKFIWLLIIVIMAIGCQVDKWPVLNILFSVERPADAIKKYGKGTVTEFEAKEYMSEKGHSFEDSMVKIVWEITYLEFAFELKNKTNNPIKIIWDKATYIDTENVNHKIMHFGIPYSKKDLQMEPTTIIGQEVIRDGVYPADNFYWSKENPSRVMHRPLFRADELKKCVGKNIQIVLPIQTEDTIYKYIFNFNIKDAKVKSYLVM